MNEMLVIENFNIYHYIKAAGMAFIKLRNIQISNLISPEPNTTCYQQDQKVIRSSILTGKK